LLLNLCAIVSDLVLLLERFIVSLNFILQLHFFLLVYIATRQTEYFILNLLQVVIVGLLSVEIVPLFAVDTAHFIADHDLVLNGVFLGLVRLEILP